jgi:16S rRNA (guanine(527)-N(7))-methyltransferase RsmG
MMSADLGLLGLEATRSFIDGASLFMDLVRERGRAVNLTGPGEMARLWERHVLESAAFAMLLDRGRPVADIGSGAGFPGIVLALLGFEVILIEPRRNRALFLEYALERLGIRSAAVERCRLEEWRRSAPQYTARAVMPFEKLVRLMDDLGLCGTLTTRIPDSPAAPPGAEREMKLPVPPLDRPGLLVQYRIPVRRPSPAAGTRKVDP